MKIRDRILKQINEAPGLTSVKLAKELSKSKSNISVHLKNLEKEGLIKKYITEENKKIFRLHPTKKGKEMYLKLKLKVIYKMIGSKITIK